MGVWEEAVSGADISHRNEIHRVARFVDQVEPWILAHIHNVFASDERFHVVQPQFEAIT